MIETGDIELLHYINDNPGFDMAVLEEQFNLSAKAHLSDLLSGGYVVDKRAEMPGTDKSKYLGLYLITEKGMALLENHKIHKQNEEKEFYKKSIITPIFVTVIANLVITLLKWLLPLISESIFHNP